MNPNAEWIWAIPAYLPYVQPVLTETAIRDAEKQLGVTLPAEYLSLLRQQNGGYIRYRLKDSIFHTISGIGPHFPSLLGFNAAEYADHVSFDPSGLIPFDRGDGHLQLCFDYREGARIPKIARVDFEGDRIKRVADSFAEYLSMLELYIEDDEFVAPSITDLDGFLSRLNDLFGQPFEDLGDYDHGYRIYRWALPDGSIVFLSPNTVQSGFIRRDDERYAEYRDLPTKPADRYPRLPANSYIITLWLEKPARLLRKLAKEFPEMRPLREASKQSRAS